MFIFNGIKFAYIYNAQVICGKDLILAIQKVMIKVMNQQSNIVL